MKMQMDKAILINAVQVWMNSSVFKEPVRVSEVKIEGYGPAAIFEFEYVFIRDATTEEPKS